MTYDELPNELKQLVEQGGSSPMGLALTAYQYGCGDLFERAAIAAMQANRQAYPTIKADDVARVALLDAVALVAAIKEKMDGAK